MLPDVHQLVIIICTIISLSPKSPFIHSLSIIEYIYWEMVLKYLGKSPEWKWKSFSHACCLWSHGRKPKNTGVGSHSLFQGIFPTQGSNPCLLHCRQILYHLRHKGSPSYLSRKYISFSRNLGYGFTGSRKSDFPLIGEALLEKLIHNCYLRQFGWKRVWAKLGEEALYFV